MTGSLCFWIQAENRAHPCWRSAGVSRRQPPHSHLLDGHAAVRESARSGLFCGGRTDATELSLENDGVGRLRRRRQRWQRANGCRGSSRDPPSLYLWWGGGGEVQVCVAGPSIHHQGGPDNGKKKKNPQSAHWMKCLLHLAGWGMCPEKTRCDGYPFSPHAAVAAHTFKKPGGSGFCCLFFNNLTRHNIFFFFPQWMLK